MSDDSWRPRPSPMQVVRGRGPSSVRQAYEETDLTNRIRLVTTLTPWLSGPENLPKAEALARANIDPGALAEQSMMLGAAYAGDSFRSQLSKMTPGMQRAVWGGLSLEQQNVLRQQGFEEPQRQETGWWDDLIGVPSRVIGGAFNAVERNVPLARPVLGALDWVADRPVHLYRAIRLGDDRSQGFAAAGAVVGAITAGAAIATTGPIGAAAVFGGGALAGGTAGAIVGSNPTDWYRAFNASWNGERTFDLPSQRKANELLGDPRVVSLAHDVAEHGIPLRHIAEDFAERGDLGIGTVQDIASRIAERVAAKGTPAFDKAVADVISIAQQPVFRDAVNTLINGKISIGRDTADVIGLDPGSGSYNVVSGLTDAVFGLAVDPTLIVGGAVNWRRARVRGMQFPEGSDLAKRVAQILDDSPQVRRQWALVADSVGRGDFDRLRTLTPTWREVALPLREYRNALVKEGRIARNEDFSIDNLKEFATGSAHLEPLLRGVGTVKAARAPMLSGTTRRSLAVRQVGRNLRAFTEGLSSPRMERQLLDEYNKLDPMDRVSLGQSLPADLFGLIDEDTGFIGAPWLDEYEGATWSFQAGRGIGSVLSLGGRIPGVSQVGQAFESVSTMMNPRRGLSLDNADEIHNLIAELRVAGLPGWARRRWERVILESPNPQARRVALLGALDNALTLAGGRTTAEGRRMMEHYITKERQAYALGGLDTQYLPDGRRLVHGVLPDHTSMDMPWPDLQELRRMSLNDTVAKVSGVADRGANAFLGVWRPAVVLRIGFIIRAAGEEMAAFMARGGLGSIVQNWSGRAVARQAQWQVLDARKRDRMPLTAEEARIHAEGPLEGHIASLARIMDRAGWNAPEFKQIDDYIAWRKAEADAVGRFAQRANAQLKQGAASPGLLTARAAGNRVGIAGSNLLTNLNAGLLGNATSWRRMALGGVNNDIVEATAKQYTAAGAALLQTVTSRNAGPLDRGADREGGVATTRRDPITGEWEEVVLQTWRGERHLLHSTDPMIVHGIWESATELLHDNVLKEVWADFLPRIAGGYVGGMWESGVRVGGVKGDAFRDNLRQWKASYASAKAPEAQMIVDEFLGAPSEDSFRSMLVALDQINPSLARHLQVNVPRMGIPDYDTVNDAVRAWARKTGTVEAQTLADEVNGTTVAIHALEKMTRSNKLNERRFVGANLKSRTSADAPLYKDFDSAYDDMRAAMIDKVTNAHQQGRTMVQLADPTLEAGQVLVFVPPRVPKRVTDDAFPTFDDLVAVSYNRRVLDENRDVVERVLEHDADLATDDWATMLASRELAEEITTAAQTWAGYVPDPSELRVAHFGDDILKEGEVVKRDLVAPLASRRGDVQAWSASRPAIDPRLAPIASIKTLDDRVAEMVDNILGRFRQVATRDVVQPMRPRVRKRSDGSIEPVVFRAVGGKAIEPLTDADLVTEGRFVTVDGKTVDKHDLRYFTPADTEYGSGTIPHELIGPIIEDILDDLHGNARWVPKQKVIVQKKGITPTGEQVRIFRSKMEHVSDAGPGILRDTVAPIRTEVPQGTVLQRGFEWAFDKAIGPGVDALNRRPQAVHYFAPRYKQAKDSMRWSLPEGAVAKVDEIVSTAVPAAYDTAEVAALARHTRAMAVVDGDRAASGWSDAEALGWLRSHADELDELIERVTNLTRKRKVSDPELQAAKAGARFMARRDPDWLRHAAPIDMTAEDFIAYAKAELPIGALESRDRLRHREVQEAIKANPVLRTISDEDWGELLRVERSLETIRDAATQFAAQAAIGDMLPFLDSHKFKTQFAERARVLMPFWYATENFVKRWARTIAMDPTSIRKMQLGYQGLRAFGMVRQDASGRDFFVIPMSGVLNELLTDLPGIGVMYQMPTDRMLPGLNAQFAAPSFSPIVTAPLDMAEGLFPQLAPLENAIVGDFAQVPWFEQIIPSPLTNAFMAWASDESSTRYLSMWHAIAAQSFANGTAPEDGATPLELDNWLNQMNRHTHVALAVGSALGIFTPAVPKPIVAGETASLSGFGVENPRELFSSTFFDLVDDLGIEQATLEWIRLYPLAGLEDIINPEALLVGGTQSKSGAVLPATKLAAQFIRDNEDYFREFPDAMPWLLPVDEKATQDGPLALDAYDMATISAMRKSRTPDEFIEAVHYKRGAAEYYRSRDAYEAELEKANAAGDDDYKRWLNDQWQNWALTFKATHPVFRDRHESGESEDRRVRIIKELRMIVRDPQAPESPQLPVIRDVMEAWDAYQAHLAYARDDQTATGRARVDFIKEQWRLFMEGQVQAHPEISSLWTSVLRPQSDLT